MTDVSNVTFPGTGHNWVAQLHTPTSGEVTVLRVLPLPGEVGPLAGGKTERPQTTSPGCCGGHRSIKDTVKGGIGLAKAMTGTDPTSPGKRMERWAICGTCRDNEEGVCRQCRCHLSLKIRVDSEVCPREKW